MSESIDDRAVEMYRLYHEQGLSYAQIGKLPDFNMSRERVRQILGAFSKHSARDLSTAHINKFEQGEFSPSLLELLKELISYGLTAEEIAEKTNRPLSQIVFHLDYDKKSKPSILKPSSEHPVRDAEIIKKYFNQNYSIPQLATEYDLSEIDIVGILKSTGKNLLLTTEVKKRGRKSSTESISEETAKDAIRLKNNAGISYSQYAKLKKISYPKLIQAISKLDD